MPRPSGPSPRARRAFTARALRVTALLLGLGIPAALARAEGAAATLARHEQQAERALQTRDPLALARLYAFVNLTRVLDFEQRSVPALRRFVALRDGQPLAAAHARVLLARELESRGDRTAAQALYREVGLLEDALVLGPFDDAAGGGHDEAYAPEQGSPGAPETFAPGVPGKGHPVAWRPIGEALHDGGLHVSHVLYPASEGTAYVFALAHAERPTRVALRLGCTDAHKVWVGGRLVLSARGEHRAELDQTAVAIELPRGDTPVVFKLSWRGKGERLFARLSAPDGGALREVGWVSGAPALEAALRAAGPLARTAVASRGPAPVGLTDALDRAIATKPTAELYLLRSTLAAVLALFDRKRLPSPPVSDLERAIALEPRDPWLHFFLGIRLRQADPARADRALEQAVAIDPGFTLGHTHLGMLALDRGQPWTARAHVDRALQAQGSPDSIIAELALLTLLRRGPLDRAEALARAGQLAARLDTPPVHALHARLLADAGLRAEAEAEARAALEKDPRLPDAYALAYGGAIERGDAAAALELVEGKIQREPAALGPRLTRARLVADVRGLAAGRAILDRDAGTFGDRPELLALGAQLAQRAGDGPQAEALLARATRLDPERRDLARQLAILRGQRGELEDVYGIDASTLLHVPVSDAERKAGAIVLLERVVVRLDENGHSSKLVETVVRLFKRELADQLRATQVRFAPTREAVEILRAERLSPDGRVERATRSFEDGPSGKVMGMYVDARWRQIEFGALEPGDVVHLRYRIDSRGPNIFGGFFGELTPVHDQLPKRELEFIALAPADHPLFPAVVRIPAPQVSIEGGVQRIRWQLRDVPPLVLEPSSPAYTELGTLLGVSTYASWDDLGRWYANLFRDQMELDDAARRAAKSVLLGARDDAEKVRRLYDYVVKNTRYVGIELGIHGWKPFSAAEVHRRRYGDCKDKATLLAALLRYAGIEATIALVRTVDRGPFPDSHATMWAFNHAITYVPSLDLYLDGTAEYSGTTELPPGDQGAFVLVVWPDGRVRLDHPPEATAAENMNRSSYTAQVEPDGAIHLQGEERFYGAHSAELRQEYQEPRTQRQELEGTLSQVAPGAEILALEVSDLSRLEEPPSYTYEARLPRHATVSGDKLLVPLTLFPHRVSASYGALDTRKTDLITPFAWSTRNVVRYRVPPGFRVESLPEGQHVDSPYAAVDQSIRAVDGGYEVDDTVTLKQRRIPAAAYPAFREALLAIDRALERKVVLTR